MEFVFSWYRRLWRWAASQRHIVNRIGGFVLFALAVAGFIVVIIVLGALTAIGSFFS